MDLTPKAEQRQEAGHDTVETTHQRRRKCRNCKLHKDLSEFKQGKDIRRCLECFESQGQIHWVSGQAQKRCRLCTTLKDVSEFTKTTTKTCRHCSDKQRERKSIRQAKAQKALGPNLKQCVSCNNVGDISMFQSRKRKLEVTKECLTCREKESAAKKKKIEATTQHNKAVLQDGNITQAEDGQNSHQRQCTGCFKYKDIKEFCPLDKHSFSKDSTGLLARCTACRKKDKANTEAYRARKHDKATTFAAANLDERLCQTCRDNKPLVEFKKAGSDPAEYYKTCNTCRAPMTYACPITNCFSHLIQKKYSRTGLPIHLQCHEEATLKCTEKSCSKSKKLYNFNTLKRHKVQVHETQKVTCSIEGCSHADRPANLHRHQFAIHGVEGAFNAPTRDDDDDGLYLGCEAQDTEGDAFELGLKVQNELESGVGYVNADSWEPALAAQDDLEWNGIWQLLDEAMAEPTEAGISDKSKTISDQIRKAIKSYNDAKCERWNDHLVVEVKGARCLGPRLPVNGCIVERCPDETDISLETSRLRRFLAMRQGKCLAALQLRTRCAKCSNGLKITLQLTNMGCLADADAGPKCQITGCDAPRWEAANSCMAHLIQANTKHNAQARKQAADELKVKLRADGIYTTYDARKHLKGVQVTCPPKWRRVKEMQECQDPNLFYVDLEGDLFRGIIYEATFLGPNGKVLLHAQIDYKRSTDELRQQAQSIADVDPLASLIACRTIKNVYGPGQKGRKCITPIEFLEECKKIGITKEATLLGWDINGCDLRALRRFTAPYGGHEVFPEEGSSPAGIRLWQSILPKSFSFKLELLFPLFFPNDPLVGLNHLSLPDTIQAYKMINFAFELFKPRDERELTKVGLLQGQITNFFREKTTMDRKSA